MNQVFIQAPHQTEVLKQQLKEMKIENKIGKLVYQVETGNFVPPQGKAETV